MCRMALIGVFGFWLLSAAASPTCAEIPVGYTVTDLGTLAGAWTGSRTRPWGINDSGEVVGHSLPQGANPRAFRWNLGVGIQPLSQPSGSQESRALDINAAGQIVGWFQHGGVPTLNRACIWDGDQRLELPTLGGPHSYGMGINGSGVAVGYSYPSDQPAWHAFRYEGGTMTDLGTLGGTNSLAYDISDSGQVVGYAQTSDNVYHAVIWNGSITDLGEGTANAISSREHVVGVLSVGGDPNAFLHDDSGTHVLGVPAGFEGSEAIGLNSDDTVVGYAWTAGLHNAYVWDANGLAANLNDLVPVDFEWTLEQATDINGAGQIVAYGGKPGWEDHAFLLLTFAPLM